MAPRVVVDVASDGRGFYVGYRRRGPLDPEQLRAILFQYAETERDLSDPAGPSGVVARIRCDRDVPFREVQKVLDACMDPAVRIYRIEFAVRFRPASP